MPLGPEFKGARLVDGPMTAVDIWHLLHTDAKEWAQVPRNSNFFKLREMIDEADQDALRKLREFEADHWEHLCFGAGWTVMGSVGLSWCKEATLDQVSSAWQQAETLVTPNDRTLRAASMLCPGLLPESTRLGEIIQAVERNSFKVAIILAACDGNVEIDLGLPQLERAPETLIPMLSYALQKTSDGAYSTLLDAWQTATQEA